MDRPRTHPPECAGDGCQEKERPSCLAARTSPSQAAIAASARFAPADAFELPDKRVELLPFPV